MDQNKLIIRNVIRVIGIVAAVVAAITAFIFRKLETNVNAFIGCCVAARIGAIVLFAAAIAFLIFDIVTKAYPISIGAGGLGLAAIAFVGNFLIAPASSALGLLKYAVTHMSTTQLAVGSYMVLAAGVLYASYSIGCMKKGK